MELFNVYVPGMEVPRVDKILNYGILDKLVTFFSWEPAGSYENDYIRLKCTIGSDTKKKAKEIRTRLGCRYAGIGKDIYFMVDERGRCYSKDGDIDYEFIESAIQRLRLVHEKPYEVSVSKTKDGKCKTSMNLIRW